MLALCLAASVLTLVPPPPSAQAAAPGPFCEQTSQIVAGSTQVTVTCEYTGAAQYWQAPSNITGVRVEAFGAQGGRGVNWGACPSCTPPVPQGYYEPGGKGASVTVWVPVTGDQTYQINVGGRGGPYYNPQNGSVGGVGGFNGGGAGGVGQYPGAYGAGGGGASDFRGGTYSLNDRQVVAGGGGGAGGYMVPGGAAGQVGSAGGDGYRNVKGYDAGETGGRGASQTAGGAPGVRNAYVDCTYASTILGTAGSLGNGGTGGSSGYCYGGGGGGGGLYGGGGGNETGGGGGGGSSYGPSLSFVTPTYASGVREGNGMVRITYSLPNPPMVTSHSSEHHHRGPRH